MNQPGLSWITVNMQDTFDGSELPEIWTKLRNRVNEAAMPSGATQPYVNDGFGDVYGLYYAVTAEGYSDAEVNELSTYLRRELLLVDGVSDVALSGVPNEVIYVEPQLALSTTLGIPPTAPSARYPAPMRSSTGAPSRRGRAHFDPAARRL